MLRSKAYRATIEVKRIRVSANTCGSANSSDVLHTHLFTQPTLVLRSALVHILTSKSIERVARVVESENPVDHHHTDRYMKTRRATCRRHTLSLFGEQQERVPWLGDSGLGDERYSWK